MQYRPFNRQQRALGVFAVCSGVEMMKDLLIISVCLAYFSGRTSGKSLPNEIKGWSLHHGYPYGEWHLPQREGSRASKKVHEAKLTQENMSGSTSRAYYVHNLLRLTHGSANPKRPLHFPKVRVCSISM